LIFLTSVSNYSDVYRMRIMHSMVAIDLMLIAMLMQRYAMVSDQLSCTLHRRCENAELKLAIAYFRVQL
jgi:hypothetical protein